MEEKNKIKFIDFFLIVFAILFSSITFFSYFFHYYSVTINYFVYFTFFLILITLLIILTLKTSIDISKQSIPILIFIFALFLRFFLPLQYVFTGTNIDGARHLDYIYSLYESSGLKGEGTLKNMQGYPPGYHLLVSFFWNLFDTQNLYFVMGIPAFFSSLSVLAIYSTTEHIFDHKAAMFAGFFAAISRPLIYMLLYSYYPQTVATTYISILLLLFVMYLKSHNYKLFFVILFALGANLITYDPIFTLIFIICILFWTLTTKLLHKAYFVILIFFGTFLLSYPYLADEYIQEGTNKYVLDEFKDKLFENSDFESQAHQNLNLEVSFNTISYFMLITSFLGLFVLFKERSSSHLIVAEMYIIYFLALIFTETLIVDHYISFKIALSFFPVYITSGVFFSFLYSKINIISPSTYLKKALSLLICFSFLILALLPQYFELNQIDDYIYDFDPYLPQTYMGIKAAVDFPQSLSEEELNAAKYIHDNFNNSESFLLAHSDTLVTKTLTEGYMTAISHHEIFYDHSDYNYTLIIDKKIPNNLQDYNNLAIISENDSRYFSNSYISSTNFKILTLNYKQYNTTEVDIYSTFQFFGSNNKNYIYNPFLEIQNSTHFIRKYIDEGNFSQKPKYYERGVSNSLSFDLISGNYSVYRGCEDYGIFNSTLENYTLLGEKLEYVSSFEVL